MSRLSGDLLSGWLEARRLRILGLVLLCTLVVDGVWLKTHPPGPESGETLHWWPIVVNVAQGRGYIGCFPEYFPFCTTDNQITAAREPVPVFLFAGVARVTNASLVAAACVEIVLNLGIVLGIFLLADSLAGPLAAIIAALLWSVYLPALKLIPQVSGDLAATLAVVWTLYFWRSAQRTDRASAWLAAGICAALGALSRSAMLSIAPALVGTALVTALVTRRNRWRGVALFGLAFVLTLSPWVIRNAVVFGRPVLASTLSGYNLYRENYMLPSRDYYRFVAGEEATRAIRELIGRRPDLRGTENEADMNAIYTREALRVIEAWPLRYLRLSAYRFLPLWFNWGYLEAYGASARWTDLWVGVEQAVLLIMALLGLARRGRAAWPLAASVVALSLVHMLVISQLRFIVPAMPLVMVLGAAALQSMFIGFRADGWGGAQEVAAP